MDEKTKREADALMARLSVLTLAGIAIDRTMSALKRLGDAYDLVTARTLAAVAAEVQLRVTDETKRVATEHSNLLAADRRRRFRAV